MVCPSTASCLLSVLCCAGRQLPRAFCGLASLTRLNFQITGVGSYVPIVLPPQLSQLASSLLELDLQDRELGELPACITG